MTRFAGKVAVVTGGRSGIGRAIATRLRSEGARVFAVQRGTDTEFETIPADLSDVQAPARVMDEVASRAGGLDILVNNAGIMQEASIEEMDLDDWQRALSVNLTAPFLLIKHSLPHLKNSRGTIVNVGSIEGIGCNGKHAAYSASKAGLHGLPRAVAVAHGKAGIRAPVTPSIQRVAQHLKRRLGRTGDGSEFGARGLQGFANAPRAPGVAPVYNNDTRAHCGDGRHGLHGSATAKARAGWQTQRERGKTA